ncbi:hypothetical protein CASFOL_004075 [Castilleja foliolosa]|uniref:Uncharacterized protein n=1 Tax=Castilleja foliolosa TaxID=1961234 RepID=A0ABD3EMV4_9LAMI
MTVVYGRHSGCAGGSDGPLPSRTVSHGSCRLPQLTQCSI